jgi:hypothetical protein
VERNGQAKLLRPLRKFGHPRENPYGGNRDVPGADAEPLGMIEDAQGDVHRGPVEQRLAHAHEHYVRRLLVRVGQNDFPDLPRDFERRQVAPESHPSCSAEGTPECAAGLRRNTQCPPAPRWYQNRFDGLAVFQTPEVLAGAIGGLLDDVGDETGQGECVLQVGAQGCRKLGSAVPALHRILPESSVYLGGPV